MIRYLCNLYPGGRKIKVGPELSLVKKQKPVMLVRRGGCCDICVSRVALSDICLYSMNTVYGQWGTLGLAGSWVFHFFSWRQSVLPNVWSCPSHSVSDPKWLSVPPLGGIDGKSRSFGSSTPISHLTQVSLSNLLLWWRVSELSLPPKAVPYVFTWWQNRVVLSFTLLGSEIGLTRPRGFFTCLTKNDKF